MKETIPIPVKNLEPGPEAQNVGAGTDAERPEK
jgi:hypothetical protein